MGTNYYLYTEPACKTCGHAKEPLHIGKSSGGWHFSLHVIPEEGIESLDDWQRVWSHPESHIEDEYGDIISAEEMLMAITERSSTRDGLDSFNFASNAAEVGLNNLVRHVIDGRHCVGHGDGTYDYMRGEFS